MSKCALLIIGAFEPRVLGITLNFLRGSNVDVFVHVDASVDVGQYIGQCSLLDDVSVTFISDRVHVFWGGYSMIEATKKLLAAAGNSYLTYALMSDDSCVSQGAELFLDELNSAQEFIATRKLDESDDFFRRYKDFYYFDSLFSSLRGRKIEDSNFTESDWQHIAAMRELVENGKAVLPIYYGSQWWKLEKTSVERILANLAADSHLEMSFRYSAVPDEMMFQSLYMKSPGSQHVGRSFVHVDWTKNPKPFVYTSETELKVGLAGIGPFKAIRKVKFFDGLPAMLDR